MDRRTHALNKALRALSVRARNILFFFLSFFLSWRGWVSGEVGRHVPAGEGVEGADGGAREREQVGRAVSNSGCSQFVNVVEQVGKSILSIRVNFAKARILCKIRAFAFVVRIHFGSGLDAQEEFAPQGSCALGPPRPPVRSWQTLRGRWREALQNISRDGWRQNKKTEGRAP